MHIFKKCLALPLLVLALHHGQASASTEPAPKDVTTSFYKWYVDEYLADHTPVEDNAPDLMRYVSEKAIAKITNIMQSPKGLEADYFLKTQDSGASWKGSITVVEQSLTEKTALEKVTLGLDYLDRTEVQVALEKEMDGWHIVSVTDLSHRAAQ